MKVLLVYYHPEEKSFNHALFEAARQTLAEKNYELQISDLTAMDFNPVSGRDAYLKVKDPVCFKQQIEELYATETDSFAPFIAEEQNKILWCDLMILQFPLWWFGMPAVIKGWFDRCFAMGKFYRHDQIYEKGIKSGSRALLSITTGGPHEAYVRGGLNGDIHGVLRPIQRGCLEFVGFRVLEPNVVYSPAHISPEERQLELCRYAERLKCIEMEKTISAGIY